MKPLFEGLNELYKNKISHLDIKVNNIVIHKGVFKYIDFGLSSKLSEIEHFKSRSISEFNNSRFYLWYPTEYIYSQASKSDLKNEISNMKRRKYFEKGEKIHKLFNVDFRTSNMRSMTDTNNTLLNSMIDTYSLGIMIPYLFVDYHQTKHINKSMFLKDLFELLGKMCNTNYKERVKPDECLKLYNNLINKYSTLKSGSKTKKKSKKSKKSKKKTR